MDFQDWFPLPLPMCLEDRVWFLMGTTWGAAWGVSDHSIMQSESVKSYSWFVQKIIGFLLDGTHHWWVGALVGLYAPVPQIRWFGWGLFWDDIKDIYPRLKKFLKNRKI